MKGWGKKPKPSIAPEVEAADEAMARELQEMEWAMEDEARELQEMEWAMECPTMEEEEDDHIAQWGSAAPEPEGCRLHPAGANPYTWLVDVDVIYVCYIMYLRKHGACHIYVCYTLVRMYAIFSVLHISTHVCYTLVRMYATH